MKEWKQQKPSAYPPKLEGLKYSVHKLKNDEGYDVDSVEALRKSRSEMQQDLLSTLKQQVTCSLLFHFSLPCPRSPPAGAALDSMDYGFECNPSGNSR